MNTTNIAVFIMGILLGIVIGAVMISTSVEIRRSAAAASTMDNAQEDPGYWRNQLCVQPKYKALDECRLPLDPE